jgi:hypothetical protein
MGTVKTKSQFWANEVIRLYALQDELNLKILKYKPVLEEEIKGKVIESTLYFQAGWNDVKVLIFTDKTAAFIANGRFFTPHAYSDGYITEYFDGLEKNHLLVDNYEGIAEQLQKTGKDFTTAIEKRDAAFHLASLLKQTKELASLLKQAQELAEKLQ